MLRQVESFSGLHERHALGATLKPNNWKLYQNRKTVTILDSPLK